MNNYFIEQRGENRKNEKMRMVGIYLYHIAFTLTMPSKDHSIIMLITSLNKIFYLKTPSDVK